MVLKSQLPDNIVNLLFTITNQDNKLTVLWGSWLSKNIRLINCVRSEPQNHSPFTGNATESEGRAGGRRDVINFLFTITKYHNKVTVLWWSWLSQTIQLTDCERWNGFQNHSIDWLWESLFFSRKRYRVGGTRGRKAGCRRRGGGEVIGKGAYLTENVRKVVLQKVYFRHLILYISYNKG